MTKLQIHIFSRPHKLLAKIPMIIHNFACPLRLLTKILYVNKAATQNSAQYI